MRELLSVVGNLLLTGVPALAAGARIATLAALGLAVLPADERGPAAPALNAPLRLSPLRRRMPRARASGVARLDALPLRGMAERALRSSATAGTRTGVVEAAVEREMLASSMWLEGGPSYAAPLAAAAA